MRTRLRASLSSLLLAASAGALADDPSAAPRPLADELPVFLSFIERPRLIALRFSDSLLALKCEALEGERRRQDALISEESGAPKRLTDLHTAEGIALCLLKGSPKPAPASSRLEMEARRADFSANALRDFPSLQENRRTELLKPFASTIAPSQGVASDEGRALARVALLDWQRRAVEAADAPALARSLPLARELMAKSLAAARADRWRWFQAETRLPVGLRLALESRDLKGPRSADPLRPLSSQIRPLLEELWAFHWSYSRPLENAQRASVAPVGVPANRGEFFEAERLARAASRAKEQTAFQLLPADDALAETPELWRDAFAKRAAASAPDTRLYRPAQ